MRIVIALAMLLLISCSADDSTPVHFEGHNDTLTGDDDATPTWNHGGGGSTGGGSNSGSSGGATQPVLSVKSADYLLVTEGVNYDTYSWQVTIKNNTAIERSFDIEVRFLNAAGYAVAIAYMFDQTAPAAGEVDLTSIKMIDAELRDTIVSVNATADSV